MGSDSDFVLDKYSESDEDWETASEDGNSTERLKKRQAKATVRKVQVRCP